MIQSRKKRNHSNEYVHVFYLHSFKRFVQPSLLIWNEKCQCSKIGLDDKILEWKLEKTMKIEYDNTHAHQRMKSQKILNF